MDPESDQTQDSDGGQTEAVVTSAEKVMSVGS